jgi:outer membrane receptor for ferric coprogen and ferric-rhodotorulic acid
MQLKINITEGNDWSRPKFEKDSFFHQIKKIFKLKWQIQIWT